MKESSTSGLERLYVISSTSTVLSEPGHICKEYPTEPVMGENVMMLTLVSFDLLTEWNTFRKYIANEKKKGLTFSMRKKNFDDPLYN